MNNVNAIYLIVIIVSILTLLVCLFHTLYKGYRKIKKRFIENAITILPKELEVTECAEANFLSANKISIKVANQKLFIAECLGANHSLPATVIAIASQISFNFEIRRTNAYIRFFKKVNPSNYFVLGDSQLDGLFAIKTDNERLLRNLLNNFEILKLLKNIVYFKNFKSIICNSSFSFKLSTTKPENREVQIVLKQTFDKQDKSEILKCIEGLCNFI